ncbi:MAG: hypothetical protein WBV31_05240 [Terriglobales bacterium]
MRSIRTFAYAAALGLSMFTIQPTLAAAEDPHGSFTLSHEVHFQKVVLGPGDYTFSVRTMGSSDFLVLRGVDGGADAMLLVNDVEKPAADQVSRLVLVSRDGRSFASAMELPEFEMSLRFDVPRDGASK